MFLTAEHLSSPLTFLLCRQIGINQKLQDVQGIFLPFFSQTPPQNTGGIITTYPDVFPLQSPRKQFSHLKTRQYFSTGFTGREPPLTGTLTLIQRNSNIYTLGSGTVLSEG